MNDSLSSATLSSASDFQVRIWIHDILGNWCLETGTVLSCRFGILQGDFESERMEGFCDSQMKGLIEVAGGLMRQFAGFGDRE